MNSEFFNNENNLVLMTMLTIKTYLQLISLKRKTIRPKYYLQIMSCRLLFIWIKKNSFQLKNNSNNNNKERISLITY